eukprot:6213647-Pleurochrysis_carterae.AAC.2
MITPYEEGHVLKYSAMITHRAICGALLRCNQQCDRECGDRKKLGRPAVELRHSSMLSTDADVPEVCQSDAPQACRFRNAQPVKGRDAARGAEAGAGVKWLASLFTSCGCRGRAHS